MNTKVQNIKLVRTYLLDLIKDLTVEQLNKIPNGYNNNIIWNLGHMAVTQFAICYRPTGQKVPLNENLYLSYKPGSTPLQAIDIEEVESIKEMFISNLEKFEDDLNKAAFENYNAWKTVYGVEIKNIEDALDFITFHEGLHMGYILALKKLV